MKWSLATKIFLGFSLVVGVFGAVSIYGITQLASVRHQLNAVNRGLLPMNGIAAQMETLQESIRRSIDSVLRFDDLHRQRALLESSRQSFRRNMQAGLQRAQLTLGRVEKARLLEDRGAVKDIRSRLDRISDLADKFGVSLESVVKSIDLDVGLSAAQDLVNDHRRTGRLLAREVRQLKRSLKNMITTSMLGMENDDSRITGVILRLSILAVAVGIVVTILSLLALRPIRRLAEGARRISMGEFTHTVDVPARDEFGLLAGEFNRMAKALAHREEEAVRQQEETERINRQLRQSGIDLELMKLYNENIIRSIPNGILVADPQGVVTSLNPTAEKLWGLDPDASVGLKLSDLPIADALARLTDSWEKVLRNKDRLLYEAVEFTVGDARHLLCDLYITPLVGHDGNVQGVLLVGEDVTEKVRTKQALIQSERLATIGRMSALVAHEIRNPLSSIGLNTELLVEELAEREGALDGEPRDILRGIAREVERLTDVTEEYLKFARLPKPRLGPENLRDILEDLLRFVQEELKEAGIEVRNRLGDLAQPVAADESQLRQAFLNLLRNSLESMPSGGVLTIESRQDDGQVRIDISDTGQGIDNAAIARIFDPFFSTRDNGTGLGLSLTQQIVNEHGGNISCHSQPGQGTRFTVELPVFSGASEANDDAQA
jgi:PAS domain S-box-containing protein